MTFEQSPRRRRTTRRERLFLVLQVAMAGTALGVRLTATDARIAHAAMSRLNLIERHLRAGKIRSAMALARKPE